MNVEESSFSGVVFTVSRLVGIEKMTGDKLTEILQHVELFQK